MANDKAGLQNSIEIELRLLDVPHVNSNPVLAWPDDYNILRSFSLHWCFTDKNTNVITSKRAAVIMHTIIDTEIDTY